MSRKFSFEVVSSNRGLTNKNKPRKGWKDSWECVQFNYAVETPLDVNNGSYSGKRTHQPIRIIRETDQASPLFSQLLATKEVLQIVKIIWGRGGTRYITELTGATVEKITPVSHPGVKGPCQQVEFSCKDIKTRVGFDFT